MREGATLNDLVRSSELREQFAVSQAVVNAWCDDGLQYIKVGRERCFFVDELLDFLSTNRRRSYTPKKGGVSRHEDATSRHEDGVSARL